MGDDQTRRNSNRFSTTSSRMNDLPRMRTTTKTSHPLTEGSEWVAEPNHPLMERSEWVAEPQSEGDPAD